MNRYFRLDENRTPVPCDLERWTDEPDRKLLETTLSSRVAVLTVFRSVNPEPFAFFETVRVENGRHFTVGSTTTWEEANRLHEVTVLKLRVNGMVRPDHG